jgi:sugar phosphate permease
MASAKLKRTQVTAVTLLVLAGLVNYLDRSTLSIANKSVSGELGLSASQMGLLLSAFSLPYAIAQLPVGVLLDRLGSRLMLGAGMMIWSVAQLAGGLVSTLNQFILARIALGVGEAPQFPAGAKVMSDWFPIEKRGRPTGIFVASSTIAPALAPPLLTALMLSLGWRGMFVVMGSVGIVVAVAWYALYRDRRDVVLDVETSAELESGRAEQPSRAMTAAEWRSLFRYRTTWGMIIGFMGVIYMVWLYLTWLPAYLEQERGLSLTSASWIMTIPYLLGTLGQLSSGFVADKLLAGGMSPVNSRKWPICTGLLFAAAFTVPAAYTPSVTMAIVYISLAMFFINLASGASWAMVSVAAPRHLVASLGSLQNFGGYLGGSFAPVVTGIVVDTTHSFVNALLISAAVAITGAAAHFLLVRRPIPDVTAPFAGPLPA